MKINHKNKNYLMQFTKQHIIHGKGKNKTDRIQTTCKLFLLFNIDENQLCDTHHGKTQLSYGTVTQFYADQYDKIVGKKLAMINMLDTLAVSVNNSILQDKEFRTKIWKGFYGLFGAWNQTEKRRLNVVNALKVTEEELKILQDEKKACLVENNE